MHDRQNPRTIISYTILKQNGASKQLVYILRAVYMLDIRSDAFRSFVMPCVEKVKLPSAALLTVKLRTVELIELAAATVSAIPFITGQ